jgi:phosphoglycolate phosphatase
MMAARSAGTYAVGVTTGSFARTELLTAGAHIVLDSLRAFPAWYAAFGPGLRGYRGAAQRTRADWAA